MEESRNGAVYDRNNYRRHCRRLFQQWQICIILAGCSTQTAYLSTEEYPVSRVQKTVGDSLFGITLEMVQLDNAIYYYLIPNAGHFSSPIVSINNKEFTCHLLRGEERLLLTEEAQAFLNSCDTPTILIGSHGAQIVENISTHLAQLVRKPLPLPNVLLDLEK